GVGHRCGRLPLDRDQPGEGVRVLRAVRYDADAGHQVGHVARGRAPGPAGPGRRDARRLRRPGRGAGRPAEGHHGTRARPVRYERRGHLPFAIVRRALGCSLGLWIGAAGAAVGQFTPPGTGGVAALAGALKQLGANKRVLVIGAHPDDEDTELLAILSRGGGVRAAYLSLSRGEGGQNLIGPELGPELGIIRTEELLAARQLDGARQFFTRAYDFGFSKTADETFRFWPRDSLLVDVLAVIRRFRPQIVVSIFSGTPRDGHGQHQVAGILARQAFEALRDSSWGPVKLYRAAWSDTGATTLRLDGGALDPLAGRSYHQIAMAGRSRHRSQDMGQFERAGLNPSRPAAIVPLLARALREVGRGTVGETDDEQRESLEHALAAAAGVAIDGFVDDGIVIPGERLEVEATVWNAGAGGVTLDGIDVAAPPGWKVE